MKKCDILVVGSNGQLGTDMVRLATEQGYVVVGIDFPQIDITNKKSVETVFETNEPEYVINCAAFTAVDDCETRQKDAFAVNAEGPSNLAAIANEWNAGLVHISTDYVFDGTKQTPYIETDIPGPQTVYGKSKLEGEQGIQRISRKYQIYRIAWLYGLHGNNFVKTIRNIAAKKVLAGEPLKVVNDQYGTPTSTVQVCNQILKTMTMHVNGLFHCTCEGTCTWYDFAEEIVKNAGIGVELLPCTTAEFPRPAPRPKFSVLENARLKELKSNYMVDWREAFRDFLKSEESRQ